LSGGGGWKEAGVCEVGLLLNCSEAVGRQMGWFMYVMHIVCMAWFGLLQGGF